MNDRMVKLTVLRRPMLSKPRIVFITVERDPVGTCVEAVYLGYPSFIYTCCSGSPASLFILLLWELAANHYTYKKQPVPNRTNGIQFNVTQTLRDKRRYYKR